MKRYTAALDREVLHSCPSGGGVVKTETLFGVWIETEHDLPDTPTPPNDYVKCGDWKVAYIEDCEEIPSWAELMTEVQTLRAYKAENERTSDRPRCHAMCCTDMSRCRDNDKKIRQLETAIAGAQIR